MSEHTRQDIRQSDGTPETSAASAFSFGPETGFSETEAETIENSAADAIAEWPLQVSADVIAHPALSTVMRQGTLRTFRLSRGQARMKRFIDIAGSLAAIVLISPILAVVMGLLAFQRGPMIFTQQRIGAHGRIFRCYKFRTMRVDAETMLTKLLEQDEDAREEWQETRKLTSDPRVTTLGGFLRKTSFDELPQLLNVLKGDMSLVGPRPIVWREVSRYRGFIRYYLSVKPGLTGLWQVSGRNHTTYSRRVALDRAYVRNYSLGLDLKIIARTVPALLRGEGAY